MAPFQFTADLDGLGREINRENLVHQRQLLLRKAACYSGTNLCGIAINRLFAAEHQPDLVDFGIQSGNGSRQNIACRQSIRPSENPVRKKYRLINAQRQGFFQCRFGIWRSHRYCCHTASETIFQTQSFLQSMGVIRIYNKWYPFTHQCIGNRINLNLCRIRDLLDTNNNKHDNLTTLALFLIKN